MAREENSMNGFAQILDAARRTTPVVHSITNYVTVNDCANMILALGGSPIMADDPDEVEQIVAISAGPCHQYRHPQPAHRAGHAGRRASGPTPWANPWCWTP